MTGFIGLPRSGLCGQIGDSRQKFDFQFAAFGHIHGSPMPIDLGRATLTLTGQVVFTNRHEFTGSKWYNFVGSCRIMMRESGKRLLIVLLNFLLSVLDDLWSLGNQNSVFRVKSSNPGSTMVVPGVVVRGDDLFDFAVWCSGRLLGPMPR
jgi:hypothetical protein